MSTVVLVIVIAVIAIIVAGILISRHKKKEIGEKGAREKMVPRSEQAALPLKEPIVEEARIRISAPEKEEEPVQPEEPSVSVEPIALKAAASERPPETKKTEEPERLAAPGVRLDEKAEETAAIKLEETRKERKLKRLRQGLAPTRGGLIKKIGELFKSKKEIDSSLFIDLEETLIGSDVGVKTAQWLIDVLKQALDKKELADPEAVWNLLREEVRQVMKVESPAIDIASAKPYVIIVVGVNGVGKTTTIGKLATQFIDQGYKVVLAAADTFRAAAVNQLEIWGRRAGAEVVKSKEGADPSSVVFDAIKRAEETGADVVIADTAGRLHTKVPLMEEVKKISRVAGKAIEGAPHQTLLVLDATTGQNAISQVAMFNEALNVSGLVVTKLDGTAKGGVIIGICNEHKLPIRFIGIGEAKDDLREFDANDFVEALFLKDNGKDEA